MMERCYASASAHLNTKYECNCEGLRFRVLVKEQDPHTQAQSKSALIFPFAGNMLIIYLPKRTRELERGYKGDYIDKLGRNILWMA